MSFLLSHWHCILPIVGIIIAVILLRDKPKEKNKANSANIDLYDKE